MKSTGAKIFFIILLIGFGIGVYWLKNYGPDSFSHKDTKKMYEKYIKAEATIVSQESNGRVGKGATIIWTLQFTDKNNLTQTVTMDQNTFTARENGTKITIYYNPDNAKEIVDEDNYNKVMK